MRFIVTIAFVLIVAVVAGLFIYQDPGYVFIAYRSWGIEMPLWLAVVLGFFSFIVLLIILKIAGFFFRFPTMMMHRKIRKDWHHTKINSNLSLLAIVDEDWASVQKYAVKAIKLHDQFLMHYILASFAAFQRHDDEQLRQYLHMAQKNIPDARVFISLMHALTQWREGHLETAKNILFELYSHFSTKKLVVRWLYQVCVQLQDWHTLEKILPAIEDTHLLDKEKLHELEGDIYSHRLQDLAKQTDSDLNQFWETVPRSLKKQSLLVKQYITFLIERQDTKTAWKLLVHHLKQNWDDTIVALISDIHLDDDSDQLVIAEKWLRSHDNDVVLLLQLGQLCLRLNLWGKARDYFVQATKLHPSIDAYLALAQLHESLHETEQALNCYHQVIHLKSEKNAF